MDRAPGNETKDESAPDLNTPAIYNTCNVHQMDVSQRIFIPGFHPGPWPEVECSIARPSVPRKS